MVFWERLLNKQFQVSQLMRHLSLGQTTDRLHPCITISRETGSGGRLVAQQVAQALNFSYYDKELVNLIAQSAHKRRELIKAVDEKTQDAISSIVNGFLGLESLPESAYIKSLTKVVLGIAASSSAVIVGRGANFVLPKETTLRVRIIAPLATRVYYSRLYHKDKTDVELIEKMRQIHQDRKEFVRKYFSKNISSANFYDLVINMEYYHPPEACKMIVAAFNKRFIK
ncbi:hypothetical protein A2160_03560 [Candidatus Beckwithbacteria bacterium RBG_13_42_9]|uniref:Cytidylate kinase n=1 Tax=Candidatus Beckwithbacteria bacterium RBG_13_42_9 TaxID=1797457 RepID=A0A1F5E8I5_9BACT|nr:MAG: hypothetical protein A2160_03560 [Candidatus Beckwithbacteria bacterium RBG_13_42_9]